MKEKEQFQYTIMAKHHLFDLHLRELVNNKDLVFLFVKRDFIALYKQTVLGPLWAVIQPLLTTIVFTVVFGNLAKLSIADTPEDNVVPSFLFYMIGNIFWTYFASTLQAVSNTFINNRNTMGKVYYPRMAAPIATALSNLISFGIQGFIFLYYGCITCSKAIPVFRLHQCC
jgi:lipopolysaccharide transport system permease protein